MPSRQSLKKDLRQKDFRQILIEYENLHGKPLVPGLVPAHVVCPCCGAPNTRLYFSDGNPSYPAGIHCINAQFDDSQAIHHKKVIGLQNLDDESEEFRSFKQLIERLNSTYKSHVRPVAAFNSTNGAVSLTTLFVTHYNFLRPHMSLKYQPPVPLQELKGLPAIQARWTKILSLAA